MPVPAACAALGAPACPQSPPRRACKCLHTLPLRLRRPPRSSQPSLPPPAMRKAPRFGRRSNMRFPASRRSLRPLSPRTTGYIDSRKTPCGETRALRRQQKSASVSKGASTCGVLALCALCNYVQYVAPPNSRHCQTALTLRVCPWPRQGLRACP